MTKKNLPLLVILLMSLILSMPLFQPGLFQIHDDQHIARLFLFDKALKAGQFPVRWVDGLGFGFGYPLFIFYPPLAYFLGEIFHITGFGLIDSIKIVFFLSVFLSGTAIYVFTKELWGRFPAIIAAIFYMIVPYRAVDIYIRGALAESFSFVWPPLILWSLVKLFKNHNPIYAYLTAIFLALLVITHNLIFLPFMLIFPFYVVFLFIKTDDKRFFAIYLLLTILTAAALSAFFWAPSLLEKHHTIVDEMLLTRLADYKIHFLYPQQLWDWTWGFGGSAEGLADGISFKVGKLHILVSIAAFALVIWHLMKSKNSMKSTHLSLQLSIVFFLFFTASAFMTTFYSKFIWDNFQPLAYLQFPWRYLLFTSLFSSILAGSFIFFLRLPILRLLAGAIFVAILLFTNLKLFQPQGYRLNLTDNIATSSKVIKWDVSQTSFEYIPKGVDLIKNSKDVSTLNISQAEIPEDTLVVLNGEVKVNNLVEKPHRITFQTDSIMGARLQANLFNFPNWQVKIDGSPVKIEDDNKLKLVQFQIPSGVHDIEIGFANTTIRLLTNSISLVTIFIATIIIIRKWRIR